MDFNIYLTVWNILIAISTIVGLTFGILLLFTNRKNKAANQFMAIVVIIMSLWLTWVYIADTKILDYYPRFTWFPITSYLLIVGPALYFYVRKLITPDFKLKKSDYLHFSPLLLDITFHGLQVFDSYHSGVPIHRTKTFELLSPILQLMAIISVAVYVILSIKKIKTFTLLLIENYSNSEKYKLTWLKRIVYFFGIMWLLWLPYTFIDYFFFEYQLNFKYYYPLYLIMGIVSVWMGMEAFLRPEYIIVHLKEPKNKKTVVIHDLEEKIAWLQEQMNQNLFFLNSELTLNTLAENLQIHPNLLSRIINEGTKKNFSDFINEYRVHTVIEKMKSKSYENITLIGMAHESGFNSKTSFYRTFKKFTNKTPSDYLKSIK
ncbi:transcriptional regulator [Dokdonia pacifica]|uniref:Transcriptional regulator, AraC family n=1 Tax=Dokdonia pacifica TaxID=1627892 RepID=A0A239AWJ1_9FLAO|nr:helix-turn-helix domain-containing protein [Dokdonia pacifica]GGG32239.1 transcriptional regulator [Dokdonia pacifica]SNS00075.1 transcriptional regulator, AraC family [Dokdonia pacifica]